MMHVKLPFVPHGKQVQCAETGSWRTFTPIQKRNLCTKCGICVTFCPDGIIHLTKQGVEIDYTFCKGCGVCAEECPAKAIEMVLEQVEG